MGTERRSPPTARVVAVLDRFVAARGERLGLSAVARDLGLSKPTCLGILTELTAAGYLLQDPVSRSYGLGPALIAAGRAARAGFAAADVARRHLAPLVERFGATCAASTVVDDQIMVIDAVSPPGAPAVKVGQRYPFAPPSGLMYVLWGSDAEFDRWLAKEPTLPMRMDRDHLREVVTQCRAAGYLVESLTATGLRLHTLMAGVAAYDLPPELRTLMGELASSLGERVHLPADLDPDRPHPVHLIAAPTYDANGSQELVLTLYVGTSITGTDITTRATALRATAHTITTALGGHPPPHDPPP
ncbi:helix-turn-helix domain-containing protein [Actinocorallia lasiicapitis]